MKISLKQIIGGISLGALLIVGYSSIGNNELGYRQVVKNRFTGNVEVVYDQGMYNEFGSDSSQWVDFMSYDFSAPDNSCDYEQKDGVAVQYQDGGKGVVCGMVRVQLPTSADLMEDFHVSYRDEEGARHKLLNQYIPKVLNLTAGLISSEDAYATKRAEYQRMFDDQLRNGPYKTQMVEKEVPVDVNEDGETVYQKKEVPEIVLEAGLPVYASESPFKQFGVAIATVDVKQYDFEKKTLDQIDAIRGAKMAMVTAKTNAKKAYWEEQEVIAQGKRNEAEAEYAERMVAAKQIVQAERDKEMAEIVATQKLEVAKLAKQEAAEKALAALEYKKEQILIGEGDSERNALVVEAGATPKQRLDALVKIMEAQSQAQAKRQVPQNVMYMGGAGEGGQLGAADDVQALLGTQLLKNMNMLGTDLKLTGK